MGKNLIGSRLKSCNRIFESERLDQYLNKLGFNLVGYGCTPCIGNSGPLLPEIEETIINNQLVVASVLSGNRNFEGRIHSLVRGNYLASPPLVVAYALAGNVNINLEREPIGQGDNGKDIYLKDIWPEQAEIECYINNSLNPNMFKQRYSEVFVGDDNWQTLKVSESSTYNWNKQNTYINLFRV